MRRQPVQWPGPAGYARAHHHPPPRRRETPPAYETGDPGAPALGGRLGRPALRARACRADPRRGEHGQDRPGGGLDREGRRFPTSQPGSMSNGRLRSSRRTYLLPILLPSHSTGITNSRIPSTGSCSTRRLPRRGSSTIIRIRIMRSPRDIRQRYTRASGTVSVHVRSRARPKDPDVYYVVPTFSAKKKNGTAASIASRKASQGRAPRLPQARLVFLGRRRETCR